MLSAKLSALTRFRAGEGDNYDAESVAYFAQRFSPLSAPHLPTLTDPMSAARRVSSTKGRHIVLTTPALPKGELARSRGCWREIERAGADLDAKQGKPAKLASPARCAATAIDHPAMPAAERRALRVAMRSLWSAPTSLAGCALQGGQRRNNKMRSSRWKVNRDVQQAIACWICPEVSGRGVLLWAIESQHLPLLQSRPLLQLNQTAC